MNPLKNTITVKPNEFRSDYTPKVGDCLIRNSRCKYIKRFDNLNPAYKIVNINIKKRPFWKFWATDEIISVELVVL